MYRAFRIINNQYGGCVVYIHDVSIHNASELTFAKTGNCPNVSHISHCAIIGPVLATILDLTSCLVEGDLGAFKW